MRSRRPLREKVRVLCLPLRSSGDDDGNEGVAIPSGSRWRTAVIVMFCLRFRCCMYNLHVFFVSYGIHFFFRSREAMIEWSSFRLFS